MEQVSRVWFTPQQKVELWERWETDNVSRRLRERWQGGIRAVQAWVKPVNAVPKPRCIWFGVN